MSVSLIRDVTNKENLIWQFGYSENKQTYQCLFNQVIQSNVDVLGVVADGRQYFFEMFGNIPVQMCQFHMAKILTRYLTRKPRLNVNRSLWQIWNDREKYTKVRFEKILNAWWNTFEEELNETYIDQSGKQQYVKVRTRKAYNSLRRYTPWLFIYQDNQFLPKTNNSIEGTFSGIKKKVGVHNGLQIGRKMKIIHYLLSQK